MKGGDSAEKVEGGQRLAWGRGKREGGMKGGDSTEKVEGGQRLASDYIQSTSMQGS